MASGPITSWQIGGGTVRTVAEFIFLGSKITADADCSYEIKRLLLLCRQHIKKQRHYFANKGPSCQSFGFSSSHVWTWKLDYKESWVLKNWCFWTMVWRRVLRVPWTARRSNQLILKEINPNIHWKDWCWAETPILWTPDVKNWLIGKDPNAGKDQRQEEKGMTEEETVEWHHRLSGHEFE